jgi:non-heme chloroperoxidase
MRTHTVVGGGGVSLHVVETGETKRPAILLLHGISQTWLAWHRQLNSELATDFRIVAMDLRGHGRSSKPRNAYQDSRLWADDIRAVIEALELDRPILCGWSYAPLVILDYVRHYGDDDISGMQFIGGVTRLGSEQALASLTPEFRDLFPGLFSNVVEESVRGLDGLLHLCLVTEPSQADAYLLLGCALATPPHVRLSMFSRSLDNDDVLARLRRPVLITHGTADAVVKSEIVREHTARIKHAQVDLIEGAGHAPFWENSNAFNPRLAAFAKGCER